MTRILCRTCLEWSPLSSTILDYCQEESLHVYEIIMSFCQVEIKPTDGLPRNLCGICLENIKNAYSFKIKCERAESILKQIPSICDDDKSKYDFITNNLRLSEFVRPAEPLNENMLIPKPEFVSYNIDIEDKKEFDILSIEFDVHENDNVDIKDIKNIPLKHENNSEEKTNTKRTKTKKNTINCTQCKFKTNTLTKLKIHKCSHAGKKPPKDFTYAHESKCRFSCPHCDFKSKNTSNLNRHIKTHSNEKPFSCDICSHKCARLDSLNEHKKTHSTEKPYLCDKCHYTCNSSSGLRLHKINKHSVEKPFACNDCNYRAKTKSNLAYHIKMHSGDKKYSCDACPYRSITTTGLKNHKMTVHSDERPFACDECSYRAVSRNYIKLHKRKHLVVKRYSCDACPYTCHTRYRLKIHHMTHTGEKPYHCSVCEYKCSAYASFTKHKKSHVLEDR